MRLSIVCCITWLSKRMNYEPDYITSPYLTHCFRQEKHIDINENILIHSLPKTLHGGFVGNLISIEIQYKLHQKKLNLPKSIVLKSTPMNSTSRYFSIVMKTYRENIFYDKFYSKIELNIPKVYFNEWSKWTGKNILIMENVFPSITLTPLLGNQCWGNFELSDDLPNGHQLTKQVMLQIAKFHAKFWNLSCLFDESNKWLNHANYLNGKDQLEFEFCKLTIKKRWDLIKSAIQGNGSRIYNVKWNHKLIPFIEKAIKYTTWDNFQHYYNRKKHDFTLCHGDFHANNILYHKTKKELYYVDWAVVGVWKGVTDIAQFLISNYSIHQRRHHEHDLLELYWKTLTTSGVNSQEYPFEQCWIDYRTGGIERWIQMLIIMASWGIQSPNVLSDQTIQWFHDQVEAFLIDHGNWEENYLLGTTYCVPI